MEKPHKHQGRQDRREVVSTGQHLWTNLRHSRTVLPLLMHFRHNTHTHTKGKKK